MTGSGIGIVHFTTKLLFINAAPISIYFVFKEMHFHAIEFTVKENSKSKWLCEKCEERPQSSSMYDVQ